MSKRYCYALLALLLLGFISGPAHSREDALPPKPLAPHEHHSKIESSLLLQARALTLTPTLSLAGRGSSDLSVIIETDRALDNTQSEALGVQIEARSRRLLRARLPAQNLRALVERIPEIAYIRKSLKLHTLDVRRTEGLIPTGALLLQSAGYRGQNVKVAIIDLGFAGLTRAKRVGALNPKIIVDEEDYSGEGLEAGTSHGTGVAEIVHAMAPQAWLYLKKVSDEVDLENAVDDAIAQGVQIINHSVGVANANFNDGTGIVAEIVDRARAHGILWVNAAGNHAQSHWMGRFQDRNYNRWLEFAPGREDLYIRADFPGAIELFLTWDDWPRSGEDFDLFLYDAQGRLVASSQNYQTGYESPTEEIQYVAWTPGIYRARILARRVSRGDIRLKLFDLSQHSIEPHTLEGSILTPADARGALAVGAISARLWKSGPQQSYSSQGPTSDGRIKPDLAGPDAVSNYTLSYFTGTSAAAPHVAGAAALLLSQNPHWTADALQNALESQAIDMGAPSKDTIYGAGRLDLALGKLQAQRKIVPQIARPGDTLTVTVEAQMPAGFYGGLVLRERPPWGEALSQTWPIVSVHETERFVYQIQVPKDLAPGVYRWRGSVNESAITGDESILIEAQDSKPSWQMTIRSDHVRFIVTNLRTARLKIFDLRGLLLFEETSSTGMLEWRFATALRRRANGVYLYLIEIVSEGRVIRTHWGKLVILR